MSSSAFCSDDEGSVRLYCCSNVKTNCEMVVLSSERFANFTECAMLPAWTPSLALDPLVKQNGSSFEFVEFEKSCKVFLAVFAFVIRLFKPSATFEIFSSNLLNSHPPQKCDGVNPDKFREVSFRHPLLSLHFHLALSSSLPSPPTATALMAARKAHALRLQKFMIKARVVSAFRRLPNPLLSLWRIEDNLRDPLS